jgi:hypothetical protein
MARLDDIENVGKSPLDETGKYPVNEYGEKRFAGSVSLPDSWNFVFSLSGQVIPGRCQRVARTRAR